MNQRNTITIGRVVLHLLGREPVDVGSLEVELTIPGADVPVEKPVMADFPMSQPSEALKETTAELSDWNRRVLGIMKSAPEPWKATVAPPLEPKPVDAPANRPVPLDAENADSPVLAELASALREMGGIKGTAQEVGDAIPQWQGRTAPSRQMRAYKWLSYIERNPEAFPDLTVTQSGKPIRWVVLVDGRDPQTPQTRQADKLSPMQRKVYDRIRELLAQNVDALDGAVSDIVGKLGMAVRDLAPILNLLGSMWLIEWSRVASSEPDIDAFWRIDLLGGGAP
jgi:hypothetical protein